MFSRECPICKKTLTYTTKGNCDDAIKNNRPCRSCTQKGKGAGIKNNMAGKSVYNLWVEKYGKDIADQKLLEYSNKRKGKKLNLSPEAIIKRSHFGKDNPRYGKSLDQVLIEKYGEEEGKKRIDIKNKIMHQKMSGSKNPMYGKPSPQGSGNGWSGWFKGVYFRSLLELSYIKYLIDNNIEFESGELSKYKIEYFDSVKQQTRNYFPDFYLIDTNELVEIKPKRLCKSKNNIDKFAEAFKQFGNKFHIITEDDINKLTDLEIKFLHDSNDLKFLDRYEQKYLQRSLQ